VNPFALFLGLVVLAYVVARQRRVRPVPRRLHLKGPIFLGILGIVEFSSFANDHSLSSSVFWLVVLSLVVGGGVLGAIRAYTVKIWTADNMVLRQGTWLTVALWFVSVGLHFASDWGIDNLKAPSGLASATLLLYLAITYGAQTAIVFARSGSQRAALGPVDPNAPPFINVKWFGAGSPFGQDGSPFGQNNAAFYPNQPTEDPNVQRPTAVIPASSEVIDAHSSDTPGHHGSQPDGNPPRGR
jgi:hypothetical protein